MMSNWTAASSDCSRPVNNYVHVKTADLYRPNARFTQERQVYQVLTPFGKLGYSPDFDEKSDVINCETKKIKKKIEDLWDKLPKFRDSMTNVPTLHVPNKKSLIKKALQDDDFQVQTKRKPGVFFYPC